MGVYRIARRLNATAGVLEGFIGVNAETEQPVVVKRLLGPWRPLASDLDARLENLGQEPIPGLTQAVEVGRAKDQLWLVQALVDAESLRQVMNVLAKQKGFISPNEGLAVVGRLSALLSTLHGRPEPLVHGDVCASTVLLTPDGNLLLADAALALSLGPTAVGPARSEPFALAPEQLTQPAGPGTDVFRLGLMLYELAVGRPLFYTGDMAQALTLCQRYTGLSKDAVVQVPEPWRSLLVEMLAVEPIDRPTAATVEQTLAAAAAKSGWGPPEADISRLLKRAFPDRQSLATLAHGGTQLLEVTPLKGSPMEPPALGDELEPKPSGRFSALPAVPSPAPPPMRSSVSPPPMRSSASPAPMRSSASPVPVRHSPPSPPTGAVVGRISTRKMSRSELEAARNERSEPTPPPPERSPVDDPTAPKDARLGALLVEKALITAAQLAEARQQVGTFGGTLAEALAAIGACDEDAIVVTLAGVTKTPHLSSRKLAELVPPAEALSRVSLELARKLDLVPLGLKGGTQLVVAMKDPMDMDAQEQLKAASGLRSIVAMRAGENAIRRARNRFYAQDDDGTPDWLERRPAPSRPLPPPPVPSSPSALEPPVVTGALLPQVFPGDRASAAESLEQGTGRLAVSLLSMMGERGQTVLALAATAAGLATRLGASMIDVERVRFAAAALGVANLQDGRPAFEVPTVGALAQVLGEHGWNSVEPLVGPWLDWPSTLPTEPPSQALCLAFGFALHAGTPRPRPSQLGGALNSFRARFQLPSALLEVLVAELSGPG